MIDTHCHIHGQLFQGDATKALKDALDSGVETIINVGTDAEDSERAVEFAKAHNLYAAVAQHPHDAKDLNEKARNTIAVLAADDSVVGIGECGLDYYYDHSPREQQKEALRWHLELAMKLNKPLSFHVRNAFADFWPVYDDYKELNGVVHSFTATTKELHEVLNRGLYVAFNGIVTFTKDGGQLAAIREAPLERILLETDAPFLTPTPLRGKINEPKNIHLVAEKIAIIKELQVSEVIKQTSENARSLFKL